MRIPVLFALWLAACATLYAPWRRPGLALAVSALAYACTWTTHGTAVLLGPGWVALVGFARARVAAPFRTRTLLLVVGPVLLGAAKPVHILTASATVRRIVNMTALTVADANAER